MVLMLGAVAWGCIATRAADVIAGCWTGCCGACPWSLRNAFRSWRRWSSFSGSSGEDRAPDSLETGRWACAHRGCCGYRLHGDRKCGRGRV